MEPRDVIVKPIITEKSMLMMADGKYTFAVDRRATKVEIRMAVENVFGVKVRDINTMRVPGKFRRLGWHRGYKPEWKKAVVTLEEGEKIAFFEGMM